MTKLPATFLEAEARAFADDWIRGHCEPYCAFHKSFAERLDNRHFHMACIERYPLWAQQVVAVANAGSTEADIALRDLYAERANKREPINNVTLEEYNIRYLRGTLTRKSGPKKIENLFRNIGIFLLVQDLIERFPKLGIYHNPKAHQPTVTAIAAAALTDAGIGISLTPGGVRKIWECILPVHTGNFAPGYIGPLG